MNCFAIVVRPGIALVAVLMLWPAAAARAVVVATRDTAATHTAPGDDPGWSNMAYLHNATAIYLGNRWMLTANHVGGGNVTLTDGRAFNMVPGSGQRLTNPSGVSGSPDLFMFRLVDDPGLPTLQLASEAPSPGSYVLMIGAGLDREQNLMGWAVNAFGVVTWHEVPLPFASEFGYALTSENVMQWGTNLVNGATLVSGNTRGFNTMFDRFGLPLEAQAVSGDSGGGVFQKVDGSWTLAGMMLSVQFLANQPSSTAAFRNQTFSADLSSYREQIEQLLDRADPAWQNQANYYDADRSGVVSPFDVLLLVNELELNGTHALTGTPSLTDPLFDVTGDGQLTTADALGIINALLNKTANPTVDAAGGVLIPEPSSAVLALIGGLALVALRTIVLTRRRRRT